MGSISRRCLRIWLGALICLPCLAHAQSFTRTESISYRDDTAKWILGRVAKEEVNGIVVSETSYDSNARPVHVKSFGRTLHVLGYHGDGTVATVEDGNGHLTSLSGWHRGIPGRIAHPDGATQSATISNDGWITRVTDESGFATSYSYDAMGRISGIAYPSSSGGVAWHPTTQTFQQVGSAEYGIPAGHWRQAVSRGNARKLTYFDALWRPLLVREYDAANEGGTQRFQRYAYDHAGRTTFASYPGAVSHPATGTWTEYDPLGRVTSVSNDSENGLLTTTTAYLEGLLTRTTSPKGIQTLTRYQAWDEPSYDLPIIIDQAAGLPEQSSIDIERDVFGKVRLIRKRNASGSVSAVRRYVYDAHQQLCKSIEPEVGATVMAYDGAGNLAWSAAGHHELTDAGQCNLAQAQSGGRRVDRTYDARNRVLSVRFPDGLGNTDNWYTPTGLLSQTLVRNAEGSLATTVYTHNELGMVVGEAVGVGDIQWGIGYGFDAHGHLATSTHSLTGRSIEYAPNALGQATRAGAFALGASYHPNGGLKQFAYGNGATHTSTQNARGLPERSRDVIAATTLHDDSLDYDGHGNVAAISDGRPGGRGDRTMQYDALDRLIQTVSPMFGTAKYGYDALENITSVNVSAGPRSRQLTYAYDAKNRLSALRGPGGSTVSSLTYDAQGNLASKDGRTYQFDYGNRLRSVAGIEDYRYDGHGRRVQSIRGGKGIYSIYGHDGVLRYQRDEHRGVTNEYVYLAGSQVARIETHIPPSTPQLAVPSSSSSEQFTVSWSSVPLASRYELEEWQGSGPWTKIADSAALSVDLSRSAGRYGYRVRACAAVCGQWSNEGWLEITIPPPPAPTLTVPASSSTGNYTVSWSTAARAQRYELQERVGSGSWTQIYSGTSTSQTRSGRANGTYTYRVRGCATECGAWSAEGTITVLVPPPAPTLTVPSASNTGTYMVSWTTSTGATRYELQERVGSGSWTQLYSGASTSQTRTGRANGTYTYRVRGCATECGSWSAEGTITVLLPPPAPTLTVPASSSTGTYSVSWTTSTGATRYELQERVGSGSWTQIYSGTGTSQTRSGRANGTYAYRVRGCATECGSWSAEGTITVLLPPPAPTLTVPASSNTGTYSVSWTASTAATRYELQERVGSGSWTQLYSGASTSQTRSGRANGTYAYRVRGCATECGAWSAEGAITVLLPPPAPTLTVPASSNTGTYSVSWTASTAAMRYELQERVGSGSWTQLYSGTSTSQTRSGRANGTYTYRVRGCATECGAWSAEGTITVLLPPPAPTLTVPASSSTGTYSVSWTASTGATRYELQERVGSGSWTQIYSGTGTSQTRSGRANGTYAYRVRGCATECGSWSAEGTITVLLPPPAPTLTVPASSNTGTYSVSWTASTAATRYELQERVGSGSWEQIYSGTSASQTRSGRANGTYAYRVRGCATECGSWSTEGTIIVLLPPPAPTLTAPSSSSTGDYAVSWSTSEGADRYELQEQRALGPWSQIYSGSSTAQTLTDRKSGAYGYRVRGCAAECGSWSPSATTLVVLPPPAPTLTVPNSSTGSHSVRWGISPGADRYELQERSGSGSWAQIYSGSNNSVVMSGRADGVYAYRVRACAADCGAWSVEGEVTVLVPQPSSPTLTVPSSSNTGSYSITWSAVAGSLRYELQERSGAGDWAQAYLGSATSRAISGRVNGIYIYRVRACTSTRECGVWSEEGVITVALPLRAPTLTAREGRAGIYAVSWTLVTGADRYELQERFGSGAWTLAYSGVVVRQVFAGRADGSYAYRVRACAAECGAWSPEQAITVPIPSSTPTLDLPSVSAGGALIVRSTAPQGARSYKLEKRIAGAGWAAIMTPSSIDSGSPGGSKSFEPSGVISEKLL